eukprot:scaffold182050_cov18-Tisochrysis_lutea.AAC.1
MAVVNPATLCFVVPAFLLPRALGRFGATSQSMAVPALLLPQAHARFGAEAQSATDSSEHGGWEEDELEDDG